MTAGVVLAAGRSSRYRAAGGEAETKLVAPFRGEPLIRHAVRAAQGAGLDPLIVVTGHAAAAVRAALAGSRVHFVHNARFAEGLASSLAAGVAALPPAVEAAVILLGDMPLVRPAAIEALERAARDDPAAGAVVPVVAGRRGNPVLLRRMLFDAALTLTGDEGARRLLQDGASRVVELPLEAPGVRLDADDPDMLRALARSGEPEPAAP